MDYLIVKKIVLDILRGAVRWGFISVATWLVKYQVLSAPLEQDQLSHAVNWTVIVLCTLVPVVWKVCSARWKWLAIFTSLELPTNSSFTKLKKELKFK